jgi:RHS repeat-associated protein
LTKIVAGSTTSNYAYTSDGQTSSQGTTAFSWDGWGRLKTATVAGNTITDAYDPNGNLIARASSTPSSTLKYPLGDQFETNAAGTITTSYTEGPAGNLASYNGPPTSGSTATYLYYDAHGNLAAEANSSGTQTANHTYDPFGAPLDSVPTNTTVHRFVGRWNKQYDTTTGDVLMGARPYDPTIGRFLAVDPVPGGSLNNYDYSGQDPINNSDVDGTCFHEGYSGNGTIYAFAWNLDVAGSQAALCRQVDSVFLQCYQRRAYLTHDRHDREIRTACWNHVTQVLSSGHPYLWRPDPLRTGHVGWRQVLQSALQCVAGGASAAFSVPPTEFTPALAVAGCIFGAATPIGSTGPPGGL